MVTPTQTPQLDAGSPRLPEGDAAGSRSAPDRIRRILLGPAGQPRWARPALLVLLLGTALLYLWDLGASGDANSFYAAAVWAGTKSWRALFFGALDPGNAITVDKPPAALWIMGLSARIFGFSSWSMLAPQALEGVASVGLLYAAVRRWSGPAAGLLAGSALALTPVAALMFRFNNPDAMLVLLMVAAAYCTVRATERASLRWMLLAGTAIGFAFLAKMLQGYIILPALGLTYLVAAPTSVGRRLLHLLAGAGAIVVATGWFLAIAQLWPASARPFIGGSTNNSEWQLAMGYNGLGRIFGAGGPGGGGGGGGRGGFGGGGRGGFGGATGITRMFGSNFGAFISWMLPAALIALVALLWFTRRAPRTDRIRAATLLWGGWLLVNGLVFSFMSGIIHEYYTVALAPPIAALVAVGIGELWRQRQRLDARAALAVMLIATGVWGFFLLGRDSSWLPALRWIVLVASVLLAAGLLVRLHRAGIVTAVLAAAAVVTGFAASAAWTVATASTAHTGSIPGVGPSGAGTGGPGGFPGRMGRGQGGQGGPGGMRLPSRNGAGGSMPGQGGGNARPFGGMGRAGMGGGPGGDVGVANSALTSLLKAAHTRWAAAVSGDQSAAGLELSTRTSVMAMGGWSNGDPYPTLAQFKQYVTKGEIHYYLGGSGTDQGAGSAQTQGGQGQGQNGGNFGPGGGMPGGGGPGGGSNEVSAITSWVQSNFTSTTVGGQTVYDLTKPKSH
ncbi:MAG: hypothetical protein JWN00_892 [Actinomycetia bacterium]|nr:hypothetical protein [Actinomycetes bacterium]